MQLICKQISNNEKCRVNENKFWIVREWGPLQPSYVIILRKHWLWKFAYTGVHSTTTFQSTTDHIYDGGPIIF